MLTLSPKHMQVFSEAALKNFEDRVVAHLGKCFPNQCKALSGTELRETIQYGIKRAAKHGIIAERDVCKYIDFMMVLGQDFDKDPELPWAQSVLNNQALRHSAAKMERLRRAHRQYLQGGGLERGGR